MSYFPSSNSNNDAEPDGFRYSNSFHQFLDTENHTAESMKLGSQFGDRDTSFNAANIASSTGNDESQTPHLNNTITDLTSDKKHLSQKLPLPSNQPEVKTSKSSPTPMHGEKVIINSLSSSNIRNHKKKPPISSSNVGKSPLSDDDSGNKSNISGQQSKTFAAYSNGMNEATRRRLSNNEKTVHLTDYCYDKVNAKLHEKWLRSDFIPSIENDRDTVLDLVNEVKRKKTENIHKIKNEEHGLGLQSFVVSRLPSNSSPTEGQNVNDINHRLLRNDRDPGISVKVRKRKRSNYQPSSFNSHTQTVKPTLYLEGAHPTRPPHSTTVFLRSNYRCEDESNNLLSVPFFGDDDDEDVVSDLYNVKSRETTLERGPDHHCRRTDEIIDQTLDLIKSLFNNSDDVVTNNLTINKEEFTAEMMQNRLALLMEIKPSRIKERIKKNHSSCEIFGLSTPTSPNKNAADYEPEEKERLVKNSSVQRVMEYADVMDSFRSLFCRRCFVYDCNIHGNLDKPDVNLLCRQSLQKEVEGYWKSGDYQFCIPVNETTTVSNAGGTGNDNNSNDSGEIEESLSTLQKSILKRSFMIFQGDTEKMSQVLGAPHSSVASNIGSDYATELEKNLSHCQKDIKAQRKKAKNKRDHFSMRNYNPSLLKRVVNASIQPSFHPCNHLGPCNEEDCTCVQNSSFCTKHCVWGKKAKNFFRGCNCKGENACRTMACSCFAGGRECDPDLCRSCGACCDPPGKKAVTQTCRNDNISMRRHAHLLLGESSIKDAGWGAFTKYALKKGDFVHEYVGEVISQEEAERRGRVYDKINRSYLFNLTTDSVIDAYRKANKTKFMNHSSKPNCSTKNTNVNGEIRVGFYAKEDIPAQSEVSMPNHPHILRFTLIMHTQLNILEFI